MSQNTSDASRKPSGSSSLSGTHSPLGSPGNVQSQRRVPHPTPSSTLGVGVGTPGALTNSGLSSGWQVWGGAAPSPQRNVSASSAPATTDPLSTQGEVPFRSNMTEGWRSNSGTWADSDAGEFALGRPRQVSVAQGVTFSPRTDDQPLGGSKASFSPQRFDVHLNKDSATTPRYSSPQPPTFSASQFPSQQVAPNHPMGYEPSRSPSVVDNLALGIRGIAVEDDASLSQQGSPYRNVNHASTGVPNTLPHIHGATLHPRGPYTAFPPPEYGPYYPGTPTDPSMYTPSPVTPSSVPGGVYPPQHGMFYDFSGPSRPPGSQFYYPSQPTLYHPSHSPLLSPHITVHVPPIVGDHKRDIQIPPHGLGYGTMRSPPSPHQYTSSPHLYAAHVEYGTPHPGVHPGTPGAIYGNLGPHTMHFYNQGAQFSRRRDGDAIALRSPILEEFRTNRSRKWELCDIYGHIVEFSGDQHGSRFIQQKIESASSEEKQMIFDEIVPDNTLQLVQDVFGNYVIQKLFEHGTQVHKTILANAIEPHIAQLSVQMYACRVVQKAIEYILPEQQVAIVKELEPHVLKCVKDANGNHVVQKLIERVPAERLSFIPAFKGSVFELSTHPYGCRVLQRCFEHLSEEQTRPLMDELHKYIINLMQDQFGNYVVQYVLEYGKQHDRALVISKLRGQMLHMSRHKFASNVCEKALLTADPESRRALIQEMMTSKQDGVSTIATMMKDQYANYVLQRAVSVADQEQKHELISRIKPQLVSMRRYSSAYSKHLLSSELEHRNSLLPQT
ncbi:armadillo-type protein [Russula emetica]|nr:armadillo-type protein [Russula emetica]